jgi:hypothetical protein
VLHPDYALGYPIGEALDLGGAGVDVERLAPDQEITVGLLDDVEQMMSAANENARPRVTLVIEAVPSRDRPLNLDHRKRDTSCDHGRILAARSPAVFILDPLQHPGYPTCMGQLLTVADVAKLLFLSRDRIVQLDAALQPTRTAGGMRLYERERVEVYAGARAQRQEERRRNR